MARKRGGHRRLYLCCVVGRFYGARYRTEANRLFAVSSGAYIHRRNVVTGIRATAGALADLALAPRPWRHRYAAIRKYRDRHSPHGLNRRSNLAYRWDSRVTITTRVQHTQTDWRADYVVSPHDATGINQATARELAAIPGVTVAAPLPLTIYVPQDDGRFDENDAYAIDPAALRDLSVATVSAGSLADLNDNTIVVADRWGYDLGQQIDVRFGDGVSHSLKVAAILKTTRGSDVAYVSQRFAATAQRSRNGLVDQVYIKFSANADQQAVLPRLRSIAQAHGDVLNTPAQLRQQSKHGTNTAIASRQNVVLQVVLLFCGIAVVNTLVMAATDRIRVLRLLRLAGATSQQIMLLAIVEAVLVSLIGVIGGLIAAVCNTAGLSLALLQIYGGVALNVPIGLIAGVTGIGIGLAVIATVVPSYIALRQPLSRLES
jgi:putative ABC transport system permease protein